MRVGLIVGLLVVLGLGGFLFYSARQVEVPQLEVQAPAVLGRSTPVAVSARAGGTGIASLRVALVDKDGEHVIAEQVLNPPQPQADLRWKLAEEQRFKLSEGTAHLKALAVSAPRLLFSGKPAAQDREVKVKLIPPRLEVLTNQHYVNQGGCDMIVYKAEGASESGVKAGTAFFKGFPLPEAKVPGTLFSIFCFPYDLEASSTLQLVARDEAGNEAVSGFHLKLFPKTFRTRELPLDDGFLNRVVPEIMSRTPSLADQGNVLANYLQINRELRKANNQALAEMAARSEPRFLWASEFKQLWNSQVEAHFADHRTYLYDGKEVDRQDHLGYDLATTSHAPVTAANDGVVAHADYFGIYGNTVVIDHGYGLLTVYGHLSSIGVKAKDQVKRGQELGRSGKTGLAGGDHLHFSTVFQGLQVDPKEWWDSHWIQDRIQKKLSEFGPGPAAPPAEEKVAAAPAPHKKGKHRRG